MEKSSADLLREMIGFTAQRLMALEVEGLTGASHGERSLERINQRNGSRPGLGDPRRDRRAEDPQAEEGLLLPRLPGAPPDGRLTAVIQEAYIQGVSTAARSMSWYRPWACRVSPRARCRGFAARSTAIHDFLDRPLEGDWPYLWLDATYVKVRQAGRIVSVAVIVAVAVNDQGRREVLGMTIGASEAETFCPSSCAP